jgi:carbonic anhydrase/acetyltransferase-like protein (isoleucine patch superfamily)
MRERNNVMENKKYELTSETNTSCGVTLYRIKALKDFGNVKKGALGGFVESERNLSQTGNAWVFGDATVCDHAIVWGDAWVFGEAHVSGKAWVFGEAHVSGEALVSGEAHVSDHAQVRGYALVSGEAHVFGDAMVCGHAVINFCFSLKTGSFGGENDKNDLFMRCPQKGSFTAFKAVSGGLIAEIVVPAKAKRSSAAGNKCRCDKAKVIAFYNADGSKSDVTSAASKYDEDFVYKIGKTAEVKDFDEDRWKECSVGIHFFMSFEEARDY